jgi:chemotaxis protein CheY-P-specific phosphatase CheC
MGKKTMRETMRAAISNVMETMFFQPVQISDKDCTLQEWFSDKEALLGAKLNFTGPSSGSFYFLIPAKLVSVITANFLGLEKEGTNEEQRKDTIKEALNMIGGHMFSLCDNEGDISLGIPELIEEENIKHYRLGEIKGETVFIETGDSHLAAGVITEMK